MFGLNIAARHEEVEFTGFPTYAGLGKVYPVAINPNLAKLQELGFNFKEEPNYTDQVDFEKRPVTSLHIYVKHDDPEFIHCLRMNLSMNKVFSQDKGKILVINAYGRSTYVVKAQMELLMAGKTVDGLEFFLPHKVRPAFTGEAGLIELIRAYRAIPSVSEKTAKEDLPNLETILSEENFKQFVELKKEAIDYLRTLLSEKDEEGKPFTIGMLFGARTKDNGYLAQDHFDMYLRNYTVADPNNPQRTGWLVERVTKAQQSNSKSKTDFRLHDLVLSEYKTDQAPVKTNKDDAFGSGGFSLEGFGEEGTAPVDPVFNQAMEAPSANAPSDAGNIDDAFGIDF